MTLLIKSPYCQLNFLMKKITPNNPANTKNMALAHSSHGGIQSKLRRMIPQAYQKRNTLYNLHPMSCIYDTPLNEYIYTNIVQYMYKY